MKPPYDRIPEELRERPNWVVWRLERRANRSGVVKPTKPPFNARTGRLARTNDPATWSTFAEAVAALEKGFAGIGFCLAPPYVGVDLDGCRVNGTDEEWATAIVDELSSYTELSPSGRGLHVIVKGELPDGARQKDLGGEHRGVGLYDSARGRFLTMTGDRVSGDGIAERSAELRRIHARLFPPEPEPKPTKAKASPSTSTDDDLVERALRANDGGKFSRLWAGQWEGEYASQSEADLALCMKLTFWTDRDASRIDALFRRSGLMREKWNRTDYRETTIARAVEQTTETWQPHRARRHSAVVSIDAMTPTVELLNACEVLGGRIRFIAVERRGPMIIGRFAGVDAEAVWPGMPDLISFSKSQAILAETTQVLLPSPPRRSAKSSWEPAAQLILRLAGAGDMTSTDALRDEFEHIILSTWKRADGPHAWADEMFFQVLRECLEHRRDPQAVKPTRTCVWHDSRHCFVHQPSLVEWLSTPAARNKHYDWGEVRKALLLLGFQREQVHRSCGNETVNVRLWKGPLELLVDDET
jgi:hypothetical protein